MHTSGLKKEKVVTLELHHIIVHKPQLVVQTVLRLTCLLIYMMPLISNTSQRSIKKDIKILLSNSAFHLTRLLPYYSTNILKVSRQTIPVQHSTTLSYHVNEFFFFFFQVYNLINSSIKVGILIV